jgi:hypothetical protein
VAIGRIDFVRLPAFAPVSEVEPLRRYLRKDHAYRQAQVRYDPVVCGGAFFWSTFNPVGRSINLNALLTGTRLQSLAALLHGDAFQSTRPILWAMQGGYGGGDRLHNDPNAAAAQKILVVSTKYLATNRQEAPIGFYLLKGSYFGEWSGYNDSFMRALLATPKHGLAACWTMEKVWRFETLAAGDTLGSGLVHTAQGDASTRTTFLLGDPTCAQITARRRGHQAARRRGRIAVGTFGDAAQGHVVYRS